MPGLREPSSGASTSQDRPSAAPRIPPQPRPRRVRLDRRLLAPRAPAGRRRADGMLERSQPGGQARQIERADGRPLHAAAGERVRDLRADRHAVEVREHRITIVGHRERPVVVADRADEVLAVAAQRDGGDVHSGDGPRGALERVELVDAAVAAGDEERQRQRPSAHQLARGQHARPPDLACRPGAGRALPRPRGDVHVPTHGRGRQRSCELRHRVPDGRPAGGSAGGAERVHRDDDEQRERGEHRDRARKPGPKGRRALPRGHAAPITSPAPAQPSCGDAVAPTAGPARRARPTRAPPGARSARRSAPPRGRSR